MGHLLTILQSVSSLLSPPEINIDIKKSRERTKDRKIFICGCGNSQHIEESSSSSSLEHLPLPVFSPSLISSPHETKHHPLINDSHLTILTREIQDLREISGKIQSKSASIYDATVISQIEAKKANQLSKELSSAAHRREHPELSDVSLI